MGHIHHSVVALRLFGDDLVPEEVSQLLGVNATKAHRKDDELVGKVTGNVRIAKTGSWQLSAERREPENLDAQVFKILGQLSQDLAVWKALRLCYELDLFCGIFMTSSNDGLPLSADVLLALGERGISLDLDIYDSSDN